MDLLNKLDMLDHLDFKDEIHAANQCSQQRDFDCAREKIAAATKLVQTGDDKVDLKLAQAILDGEIERVRQEEIARQEELRRQREAEARRLAELQRQKEEAERRRRAEEEQNTAAWLGFAARMVGTGLGAAAAGKSLDTQAWNDISVGAMEDSMGGGTGMSSTTAALNKTGQRYRQESMRAYGNAPGYSGASGENASSAAQKKMSDGDVALAVAKARQQREDDDRKFCMDLGYYIPSCTKFYCEPGWSGRKYQNLNCDGSAPAPAEKKTMVHKSQDVQSEDDDMSACRSRGGPGCAVPE